MRVFLRVIDEGGFAAAARALDMSPAVVTRLVADLEEHLGTRLLHRTTRRQSLTEAGEQYVERVRMILQDLDEAHALVSSQTQELSGTLRILAPPVLATHILSPLLAGFRQAYPNILLDIEVASHREPPIEDFDVTLMGADATFDGNVVARKVISTEAILVASPAYLAERGRPPYAGGPVATRLPAHDTHGSAQPAVAPVPLRRRVAGGRCGCEAGAVGRTTPTR